jgi:hypothetical protein
MALTDHHLAPSSPKPSNRRKCFVGHPYRSRHCRYQLRTLAAIANRPAAGHLVPMSHAPAERLLIKVESDRFAAAARPVGFAMINAFVTQHAIISKALDMRPAKLLVYLVICIAAVQRVLRDPALPPDWRGTARMPRAVIGYVSRRAIAEATGLPRENVRRIVAELIAEDRLLVGPRGAVANRGGLLESERLLESLREQLALTARTMQALADAGVISVSHTGQ